MKCRHNKLLLQSISYSYEQKDDFEIRNLSLSIPENTISAVIGKNGSGKTTLLLLMMGYLKPACGQIGLCTNGNYLPIERANGRIAYLPQIEEIPREYSVNNYLLMGRIPFIGSFSQPNKKDYALIEEVKVKLEIENLGIKKLGQISGGELQRVRIGRALAQEAHLILFDEPITHMDIDTKLKIISILEELKQSGKTIIFTTHDPLEAFQIADNSILITRDQKILYGPTDNILNRENLSLCLDTPLEFSIVNGQKVLIVKNEK
jgi:ABC-type cobalamin/Fe3+-siderophores transport system ATPase subunit